MSDTKGQRVKNRVYYLDDERINTLVFEKSLREYYDVHCFNTYQDFKEALKERKPDVIVLDLLMPDISGFEVARILKNSSRFKLIPILVLTALEKQDSLVECFEMGVDDFMMKPPNSKELHARLSSLIFRSNTNKQYSESRRRVSIRQLVGGFNHEFNNHLTILHSGLEIVRMTIPDSETKKIDILLSTIRRSSELLKSLSAIADASGYASGGTLIGELCPSIESHLREEFDFSEVDLSSKIKDGIAGEKIVFSSWVFKVLMDNVVSNALDSFHRYVPKDLPKKVEIGYSSEEQGLMVTVKDNGCGIPSGALVRVFDPFYTTKGSLGGEVIRNKKDGTGLGLCWVEAVLDSVGGYVEIESELNFGTLVRVWIPFYEPSATTNATNQLFTNFRICDDRVIRSIGLIDEGSEAGLALTDFLSFHDYSVRVEPEYPLDDPEFNNRSMFLIVNGDSLERTVEKCIQLNVQQPGDTPKFLIINENDREFFEKRLESVSIGLINREQAYKGLLDAMDFLTVSYSRR
jgi:DNA-binding response OmpR family regulator